MVGEGRLVNKNALFSGRSYKEKTRPCSVISGSILGQKKVSIIKKFLKYVGNCVGNIHSSNRSWIID